MAKKRTVSRTSRPVAAAVTWRLDALLVLQVLVAVFLFTLGLIAVVRYDSSLARFGRDLNRMFGRANNPFAIIVAVVEMIAGVLILAALFVPVKTRWLYWTTLIVAIIWAGRILLFLFVDNIFEPTFLVWLNQLAADLILLAALWLINRKYA